MKRHRHTPEQALRKVREGERLLNSGIDLTDDWIARFVGYRLLFQFSWGFEYNPGLDNFDLVGPLPGR